MGVVCSRFDRRILFRYQIETAVPEKLLINELQALILHLICPSLKPIPCSRGVLLLMESCIDFPAQLRNQPPPLPRLDTVIGASSLRNYLRALKA